MYKHLSLIAILSISTFIQAQTLEQVESNKVTLPNGWSLTPAGRNFPLGDLPLNMIVSKSKSLMAVTNNGQGVQSIQLIDPTTETVLDTKIIGKAWYGLAFSADEKKLYASGNHDNWIIVYGIENRKLVNQDTIVLGKKWPNKISPTGLSIDDEKQLLYVVTKEDNKLYIVNLKTKAIELQYQLGGEAYACQLSPDSKQLYISCWGCDKVYVFDTEKRNVIAEITVGDNPNELLLTKKGKLLYVANSNDNSVSVINTDTKLVIETLNAALYPDAPNGSTTNGLALSSNEKTLFIANADNNCLAVFDVSKPTQSKSKGFIPVGWYPTNVKVIGKKIFVTNGQGFSSKANPYGPNPFGNRQDVYRHADDPNRPKDVQYIGGLFKGTMSVLEIPTDATLGIYSQVVYRNIPYNKVKE